MTSFHDKRRLWWRKYSGLVFCKSRGNSGVTASTLRHWKPQESPLWRWFHIAGKCHMGPGVALPGCGGGLGLGVILLVVDFPVSIGILLSSLAYWAWVRQHPAHEGVKSPGTCSWLGERKGSWMVVTRHLEQYTTCGISGCSEGSRACYHQLVVNFNPA